MKIKRYKRAQHVIGFYRNNYGLTAPYRVLLDGTFCQAALINRLNLREQMPKYLCAHTDLVTTACVLKELEQLGPELYGALHICKQFAVDPCPHKPAKRAVDCLASMARRMKQPNKLKYFFATQDNTLTEKLRQIAGTPILFIKFNTILIEKPSEVSLNEVDDKTKTDIDTLKEIKNNVMEDKLIDKRKKRLKGPNPLSCKKKKAKNRIADLKSNNNGNIGPKQIPIKRRRKTARPSQKRLSLVTELEDKTD